MIDDVRIRKIAVESEVPVGTIEKDFAITCALKTISETTLKNRLTFKGGTAIKKLYDPQARFSEDMDFTTINLSEEDALDSLSSLNNVKIDSITFEEIQEDSYTRQGKNYRLSYTGPLDYKNSIRFDLSFREDIIDTVEEKPLIQQYGEEFDSTIKSLSLIEIISEKIRAMITRESPRDYYDTYSQLHKISDKTHLKNLVIKKCNIVEYEYKPENILNKEKIERIEASWKTQLQHLVPKCPEFKTIIPTLKKELKFLEE
jgi:uncharacterized protein